LCLEFRCCHRFPSKPLAGLCHHKTQRRRGP
jgi:hypothetical protein